MKERRTLLATALMMAVWMLSSCSQEDTVRPAFSYREPLCSWGTDSRVVESYMTGYALISGNGYSLCYEGHGEETSYLYAFTAPREGLYYVVVSFPPGTEKEVKAYLEDRYGTAPDGRMYFTADGKTVITVTQDTGVYVTYMSRVWTDHAP